jgi:hypothetical protein
LGRIGKQANLTQHAREVSTDALEAYGSHLKVLLRGARHAYAQGEHEQTSDAVDAFANIKIEENRKKERGGYGDRETSP